MASTGSAFAGTIAPSFSQTANGTSGSGATNNLGTPSSFVFGDSFLSPISTIPDTDYSFFDDYLFSISGGIVNSITSTINLDTQLGIDNLQVRLFNIDGQDTLPVASGSPSGPVFYASTSSFDFDNGTTELLAILSDTQLAAGTYDLEIYGNVVGSQGGTYSGTLNLAPAPVPVPASMPLMLSGLGLLVGVARRRKTA